MPFAEVAILEAVVVASVALDELLEAIEHQTLRFTRRLAFKSNIPYIPYYLAGLVIM